MNPFLKKCQVTIFEFITGIGKFRQYKDGKLSYSRTPVGGGRWRVIGVDSVVELEAIRAALRINEALGAGIPAAARAGIYEGGMLTLATMGRWLSGPLEPGEKGYTEAATRARLVAGGGWVMDAGGTAQICRTLECMTAGNLLYVDMDVIPEGVTTLAALDGHVAAWYPAWGAAERVWFTSSGAFMTVDGVQVSGLKAHGFAICENALRVGKDMALHVGIDPAVYSPERVIYAGPGRYAPPLCAGEPLFLLTPGDPAMLVELPQEGPKPERQARVERMPDPLEEARLRQQYEALAAKWIPFVAALQGGGDEHVWRAICALVPYIGAGAAGEDKVRGALNEACDECGYEKFAYDWDRAMDKYADDDVSGPSPEDLMPPAPEPVMLKPLEAVADLAELVARLVPMADVNWLGKGYETGLGVTKAELKKLVKEARRRQPVNRGPEGPGLFHPVIVGGWPVNSDETGLVSTVAVLNVQHALAEMGVDLAFDTFTYRTFISRSGERRIMDDGLHLRLWELVQKSGLQANKNFVRDAVEATALGSCFDSGYDFFASIEPREDCIEIASRCFVDQMGAEDNEFNVGVASLTWVGIVRRGMSISAPVKFDYLPMLMGPQSIGKSSFFALVLGRDLYQESMTLRAESKEIIELTQGRVVAEIGELAGMKKVDREHTKSLISRTEDSARLAYGHDTTSRNRRFVMIATANDEGPVANLRMEDRRFPIVRLTRPFDWNFVKARRMDILAGARAIERRYGEALVLPAHLESMAREVRSDVGRSPFHDVLEEFFLPVESGRITRADVWAILGFKTLREIGEQTARHGGVDEVMEKLGWKVGRLNNGKARVQGFSKGEGGAWLLIQWPDPSKGRGTLPKLVNLP